jgi:ATP-dependent DNA helicase RecG
VYVKVVFNEDTRYFTGCILKMFDGVVEYLKELVKDENYPFGAIEETLANALVHRDYLDTSRGIAISINDRNIEISNPGSLIANNSVYKFSKENNPGRRNPWLYQRLVAADSGKRFLKTSAGLSRIKSAFADIGEVKFLNIGSQNLFKVILPRLRKA